MWHLMQRVSSRIHVRKVPAHMDAQAAEDLVHEWAIVLNGVADGAAKHANLNRSESFWRLWDRVRISYNCELTNAQCCANFHVAVGQRALRHKTRPHDTVAPRQQPAPGRAIHFENGADIAMPALVERWGAEYVRKLAGWLRDTFLPGNDSPPTWVSKLELFFGFLLATNFLPPIYDTKRKIWIRNPHLVAPTYKRVTWFSLNLSAVAKAMGQAVVFAQRWPSSAALGGIHPCIAVRLPTQLRTAIDRYISGAMARPHGSSSTRWRSLPVPDSCLR